MAQQVETVNREAKRDKEKRPRNKLQGRKRSMKPDRGVEDDDAEDGFEREEAEEAVGPRMA